MYETLKALTVEELKTECKDLGLRGYSRLNEEELISKILDSGKLEEEEINSGNESTIRTFKRLIPNPLTIGEIVVSKDEKTFTINESDFNETTIKRLNHSIGKIIEEI
tara:strand:- start:3581 stop:3904 length:324 start_codon:yes stop_codon:yes gene_type:complete